MQFLRFQFAAILALAPLLQGPDAGSSGWVTSNCKPPYSPLHLQQADGSWSARAVPSHLQGVYPGRAGDDMWVTSTMTLALLGERLTPGKDRHRGARKNALAWIRSGQKDDGRLVSPGAVIDLRVHAMATLVLTETCVLDEEVADKNSARRALAYLESRALESGGWNPEGSATGTLDPSTTLWAAMAVASGREFGFEGETDRLALASAALRARNAAITEPTSLERVCELLLRHFARETHAPGAFARLAASLLAGPLALDDDEFGLDPELFYLQTLVAYRAGGDLWRAWVKSLHKWKRRLHGPPGKELQKYLIPNAEPSPEGSIAGASFNILTMGVYFRYSRLVGAR